MSLEAWGDEGDWGPEGYVTEEAYDEVLDTLEKLARLHLATNGDGLTSSGGLPENAEAMHFLAQHYRFRIARETGGQLFGFWPEHDPESKTI